MTTEASIARLRELEGKATPGPWFNPGECVIISCDRPDAAEDGHVCPEVDDTAKPNEWSERRRINADLIAEMRTALPALLDERDRMRSLLDQAAGRAVAHVYIDGSEDGHECVDCRRGMIPGGPENHESDCRGAKLREEIQAFLAAGGPL